MHQLKKKQKQKKPNKTIIRYKFFLTTHIVASTLQHVPLYTLTALRASIIPLFWNKNRQCLISANVNICQKSFAFAFIFNRALLWYEVEGEKQPHKQHLAQYNTKIYVLAFTVTSVWYMFFITFTWCYQWCAQWFAVLWMIYFYRGGMRTPSGAIFQNLFLLSISLLQPILIF